MTILKHKNKPIPRVMPSQSPPSNLSNLQPITTSYSDCFSMALKFNNPFEAFTEIQKAFGLTVVELPEKFKNDLKPEFGGNLYVPPSPPSNSIQSKELDVQNPSTSTLNTSIIKTIPVPSEDEIISPKQIRQTRSMKKGKK